LVEINSDNCTVISEAKSGLTKFAQDRDIKVFELAENIGGRSINNKLQKTVLVNRPYQGNWRKRLSGFVDKIIIEIGHELT
jgi:hypothetical protein